MKLESKSSNLSRLNEILEKGKISNQLKEAVVSIIEAIEQDNFVLATDLSSVKSLVSGSINTKQDEYPYRESHEYNEKHLGNSVYSILDGIHFAYSMRSDKMPSGMMLISSGGITHGGKITELEHPIVQKINAEFKKTQDECNRRWKK